MVVGTGLQKVVIVVASVVEMLKNAPFDLVVLALALVLAFMLLVPLALRLAGLTGQQIIDVLTLTMQFFVNLVKEFRAQNKSSQ